MSGRRTIAWKDARPDTRALVAALRDTLSNEEAWAIAQDHLDEARSAPLLDRPATQHGRLERGRPQPMVSSVATILAVCDLLWVLVRVASWTNSTWVQHVRHQFGDERADAVVALVKNLQAGSD